MPYVTLDANGNVTGIFATPQPGVSQDIPDNDPRIAAFQASQVPPPSCQLWQLQAVMTSAQWTALTNAVAAYSGANAAAVQSFFSHPGNVIPADSTTVQQLGQAIGVTSAQIASLIQQAAGVAIP
ncbi:MAG TPA: hypothetical protein VLX09_02145 [Stellaceae bacterium]|nr:hypothetical protein [Stellaceae bacterium]